MSLDRHFMRGVAGSLILACAVIHLSCSRSLTREVAGKIIAADPSFPGRHEEAVFRLGRWRFDDPENESALRLENKLRKLGVLTFEPAGYDVIITKTKLADSYQLDWKDRNIYRWGKEISVFLHERKFVEVTGISAQDSAATVDFTFQWVPTRLGQALGYTEKNPEPARATFVLYDDGWRLERLYASYL